MAINSIFLVTQLFGSVFIQLACIIGILRSFGTSSLNSHLAMKDVRPCFNPKAASKKGFTRKWDFKFELWSWVFVTTICVYSVLVMAKMYNWTAGEIIL